MSERGEDDILAEARRAISVQVGQLDELRSRTGLLLAAAALSGSFLGSTAARGGISLNFWGGVAVIAFTVGVASCMVVLWPPKGRRLDLADARVIQADQLADLAK